MAEQTVDCDHLIRVDWLKQCILVFNDLDEASRELGALGATATAGIGGAGYATNEIDGSGLFWMIFPGGKPSVLTIVHEAIHVVDFLCEFVGIPVATYAGEVRAYMVEWLTGELLPLYGYEAG